LGVLVLPSASLAASGGTGLSPGGSGTSSTVASSAATQTGSTTTQSGATNSTQNGNVTVRSAGNGITLVTHASATLRKQLTFTGNAGASRAGQTVQIQRLGHQTSWTWAPTVQATVARDGSFSAVWHTNHIGRFSMRALLAGRSVSSYAASAMPTVTVTVYRQSIATVYGPGFYGQRTACGQTLRPSTIGVANRTLKCGTPVAIYYHGRTMIVPVIDRGPYANNADWDLTEAAAKAIGTNGTATIGAVSMPSRPSGT
jgi:rare lipoprotein A (peptidoglycan hydrolase)